MKKTTTKKHIDNQTSFALQKKKALFRVDIASATILICTSFHGIRYFVWGSLYSKYEQCRYSSWVCTTWSSINMARHVFAPYLNFYLTLSAVLMHLCPKISICKKAAYNKVCNILQCVTLPPSLQPRLQYILAQYNAGKLI